MKIKKPGIFLSPLIFIFLSIASPARAQSIDSLKILLGTIQNDSLKILLRNKLVLELIPSDTIEARQLLNQNMILSRQRSNYYLEGDCFLTSGILYSKLAEYELAMNNLTEALSRFSKSND